MTGGVLGGGKRATKEGEQVARHETDAEKKSPHGENRASTEGSHSMKKAGWRTAALVEMIQRLGMQ